MAQTLLLCETRANATVGTSGGVGRAAIAQVAVEEFDAGLEGCVEVGTKSLCGTSTARDAGSGVSTSVKRERTGRTRYVCRGQRVGSGEQWRVVVSAGPRGRVLRSEAGAQRHALQPSAHSPRRISTHIARHGSAREHVQRRVRASGERWVRCRAQQGARTARRVGGHSAGQRRHEARAPEPIGARRRRMRVSAHSFAVGRGEPRIRAH